MRAGTRALIAEELLRGLLETLIENAVLRREAAQIFLDSTAQRLRDTALRDNHEFWRIDRAEIFLEAANIEKLLGHKVPELTMLGR